MKKDLFFPIIVAIAVLAVVGIFIGIIKAKNAPLADEVMIFFYGDTCPHCENVEFFFTENNIEEKIEFERLEIYNSTSNAKIMADRAAKCSLSQEQLGVPLLWTGSECIGGDTDIIKYFQDRLNQ